MNFVIGIDPANKYTAYVVCEAESMQPLYFGREENKKALTEILEYALECKSRGSVVIGIEGMQSYGQPVGTATFETCYWIGNLQCHFNLYQIPHQLIFRTEEKMAICKQTRAKDSNIRAALVDLFAPYASNHGKGTKDEPSIFYGFKKDIWQAFAIAYTLREKEREKTNGKSE